jgi:putative transposase
MKQKYDSSVIYLYATGNEHLLPKEFRQNIPYTTISTWRKTDYSTYIGNGFRYFFDEAFEGAEAKFRYRQLKRTMISFARSWIILATFIKPVLKNAGKDRQLQKRVLESITYIGRYLGTDKALKLLGISKTQYYQWLLEARFDCFDSYSSLCVKRHPHQLEAREIGKIKRMLCDPQFDHWPIVSIASLALRKKRIIASLFSWYKYARIFGITKKPVKKDLKTEGLIATYPNEYLHADLTEVYVGGKKAYIAFVMDNYSKMILGYDVGKKKSFRIVKEALKRSVKIILTHPNHDHSYLVTDGGSENHNRHIDSFISRISDHKVTKIRALKDIQFSNSPVEAVHRTMKGRYLKKRVFATLKELSEFLDWAVNDYNTLRPHYKHAPKTPYEVYFDKPLGFNLKNRRKKAIQDRIKNNLNSKCIQCRKGIKQVDCCGNQINTFFSDFLLVNNYGTT